MFPAVTVPKSSPMAPSTTKISSSPTCRCRGSCAPGSMRVKMACRLVAASSQRLFRLTPGCRSSHGRSLIEMIRDIGFIVAMEVSLSGLRFHVFAPTLELRSQIPQLREQADVEQLSEIRDTRRPAGARLPADDTLDGRHVAEAPLPEEVLEVDQLLPELVEIP